MSLWLLSMVLNCHSCLDNLVLALEIQGLLSNFLRFPDIVKQMRKGEVLAGNGVDKMYNRCYWSDMAFTDCETQKRNILFHTF